jgi:tRNA (Thr-GGU) A37 N-methylase
MDICFTPIGAIHSPYPEPMGMPIQAVAVQSVAGRIEVRASQRSF